MNTFGRLFRISLFGESHGPLIGITIDGCPPGIELQIEDFAADLLRRKSGALGTTSRRENDEVKILSGLYQNKTTGAPLTLIVENSNINSSDYSQFTNIPRPGHADFTAKVKYQDFNDPRGGGHFSGRLTLGLVLAGVVAKKILIGLEFAGTLLTVGGRTDFQTVIDEAILAGDSLGGVIECRVKNLPFGLGEPFFDSVESVISHLVFAIPGIRGIEFGDGFTATTQKGSEQNDLFIESTGKTATNHAGGINGGITNGNELIFRVAVKPTSSIAQSQNTCDFTSGELVDLTIPGRHDVCFALRTPVIVEAAAAIAMADLQLCCERLIV